MNIIKIFLASSSELKSDREQFKILINRENKEYIKKSIFLELVIWEDFLDAMSQTRLQDEYNKAIANCDVFVSLFWTKVGQYTEEEFEKAFASFKVNNKPLIYTFFKEALILPSQAQQMQTVFNFQGKLGKLGHFYTNYADINELRYKFSKQLNKLVSNLKPASSDVAPKKTIIEPSGIVLKDFGFEVVTVNSKGEEVKRERKQAKYFTEELGNSVTLDMIAIPGGKFMMGSPKGEGHDRERPQHEVTVPPFFMGKYPVTQAQYQQVIGKNPSHFEGSNHPVEQVSWDDAVEFCKRLSKQTKREYRLPTEAEWEYTCRAGTITPFYFGETMTTDLANYQGTDWKYEDKVYPGNYANEPKGQYREKTTAVGIFPSNTFGLYDMHGQVWEWCQDDWHENYGGAPIDGRAWISRTNNTKILRGGSWLNLLIDCLSATRIDVNPEDANDVVGFRVVCSVPRT